MDGIAAHFHYYIEDLVIRFVAVTVWKDVARDL